MLPWSPGESNPRSGVWINRRANPQPRTTGAAGTPVEWLLLRLVAGVIVIRFADLGVTGPVLVEVIRPSRIESSGHFLAFFFLSDFSDFAGSALPPLSFLAFGFWENTSSEAR